MPGSPGAATEQVASYRTHLETMQGAYRSGRWAAWLAILTNAGLGVAKLVAGLLGGSFALVSDAVHSFSDVATSFGVLVGMRISARPADAEHPYGHSRAEAIVGLYIAMALAAAGVLVAREALNRFERPHMPPAVYTLIVAGLSVFIKEGLYQYKSRLARRIHSRAIMADAWHHRSDALSSIAVFVGIGLTRWAGLVWADELATLAVAVCILWAAISLMQSSSDELMDRQADEQMVEAVRAAAVVVPEVVLIDKLFIRKAGLEYLVDVHIHVDPELSVKQSHEIAHNVQQAIQQALPHIHSVLVHTEPRAGESARDSEVTQGE